VRPYTVAFVFARGGSKGLPGKNLRPLGGKPLVAWAIETARASLAIDRVVVSTDDSDIAAVARDHGAEVPFSRPPELATDEAPEWLAWRHAIRAAETAPGGRPIELFVSLSPTAPLRAVADVDACIELALHGDCDIAITVTPARRNPFFNMVVREPDRRCRLVNQGGQAIDNRQAAPPVFDMTTVAYAARPAFVMGADGIFAGRVKAVVVPPERAVDIDTELDFRFAELLLTEATRSVEGGP
jgi:N-acylneuraminate cytidylyltransferase